jgi:RNA polymerase sigma-70 factor, ECF subfamily
VRILSDRPAAEEVVQDVFHRLWEKSILFDTSKGEFLSWLLTMTRNIAIDSRRRETRRASFFVPLGVSEETSGRIDGSERCAEVRQILAELPPAQKTVLEMLYFEGLTNAELAQRLGEPLGTIKTRARLALGKLRTLLHGAENRS